MRNQRTQSPFNAEHGHPISLVLPAYDEGETIARAIGEAVDALSGLTGRFEVIVVDDGSSDDTATVVRQSMATQAKLRLVSHGANRGYGAALRSGFEAASHSLVAFTDADCQFHLEDLGLLIAKIENQDAVCGIRSNRKDVWLRRFYSGCYNALVTLLLGVPVRDCDCALKLFRAEALDGVRIETDGFFVNAEILTKLAMAGSRIDQVSVRHRSRAAGDSTVSPLHAIPVSLSLLRFWWTWVLFPGLADDSAAEAVDTAAPANA